MRLLKRRTRLIRVGVRATVLIHKRIPLFVVKVLRLVRRMIPLLMIGAFDPVRRNGPLMMIRVLNLVQLRVRLTGIRGIIMLLLRIPPSFGDGGGGEETDADVIVTGKEISLSCSNGITLDFQVMGSEGKDPGR